MQKYIVKLANKKQCTLLPGDIIDDGIYDGERCLPVKLALPMNNYSFHAPRFVQTFAPWFVHSITKAK